MTQSQPILAETCDYFLRQGREALARGELVSASAAGWQAALFAVKAYAGPDADFADAARQLVKDRRAHGDAAEWAVSAMALSDNAKYDWLDKDGVGRRLDDVQRLVILVKDIAEPPKSAADILRRAWECMDNGALPVASEKGWEAALCATKTYADAMGHEYRGDGHFDDVVHMLAKDEDLDLRRDASECTYAALALREAAAYCTVYPHWLHTPMVTEDIETVSKLVAMLQKLAGLKN